MERVEGIEPSSPAWKAGAKISMIIDFKAFFKNLFDKIFFEQPMDNQRLGFVLGVEVLFSSR